MAFFAGVVVLGLLSADLHPTAITYAPLRQPFRGAELYLDRDTAAAHYEANHRAPWLSEITRHPQARWLNGPVDVAELPEVAARAHRQNKLLVLVTYHIPNRDCAGPGAGAASAEAYDAFIGATIQALGPAKAAIVVEPDAVAMDCFNQARATLLKRTVQRLTQAGHHVFLDAGHPQWHPTRQMAQRLLKAGVNDAEGFSVNVANRQTTEDSYQWARKLSARLGGREFVIDTSRNGAGPPPDNEWCNPRHEGFGGASDHRRGRPAGPGRPVVDQTAGRVRRCLRRRGRLPVLARPRPRPGPQRPPGLTYRVIESIAYSKSPTQCWAGGTLAAQHHRLSGPA